MLAILRVYTLQNHTPSPCHFDNTEMREQMALLVGWYIALLYQQQLPTDLLTQPGWEYILQTKYSSCNF